MARRIMYVCFGIAAILIASQWSAKPVVSQGIGTAMGICSVNDYLYAIADNGDCYRVRYDAPAADPWEYRGNIFGTVFSRPTTWGKIKAEWGE